MVYPGWEKHLGADPWYHHRGNQYLCQVPGSIQTKSENERTKKTGKMAATHLLQHSHPNTTKNKKAAAHSLQAYHNSLTRTIRWRLHVNHSMLTQRQRKVKRWLPHAHSQTKLKTKVRLPRWTDRKDKEDRSEVFALIFMGPTT